MPTDPKSPFFYHVYEHTLPQEMHYRIVPEEKDLVTPNLEATKKKRYRRRYIFQGWDNYTDFEKEQIELLKKIMKEQHKVDLEGHKEFGPRTADSYVVQGTSEILPGVDYHFSDVTLLKYLVAQNFDMQKTVTNLKYQMEWR